MLWPAWDDISVIALGTISLVVRVADQEVDLVERGGLIAVGVLLCLSVVVQVLKLVLPLVDAKKEPGVKKSSDASIRFRTDLLRQVALVEQMARQVNDLHQWHSDEFENAIKELREEVAALRQRQP